jgi:Fe-S cluster assembly protein SufD
MENRITQISSSLYDQCIADYEVRTSLFSAEAPEINSLRAQAFQHFKNLGFPSTKVEDWKYTNLVPILKEGYALEQDEEVLSIKEAVIAKVKIQLLDCYHIVLVNGKYRADLSDAVNVEGLYISSIADAASRPAFKQHFGKYIDLEKFHFAAANSALFRNGLFIEVKRNTIVEKPLHLIHISTANEPTYFQPRQLFVIGLSASIPVIESYATDTNGSPVFINNVAEVVLQENSQMQHFYIQAGDVNARYVHHTEVYQQSNSIYNNYKASFPGTSLWRNNLNVALDGENVESHLYGLYLAGGHQLVDNHTIVDHRKPHCNSNELYKGVMKDDAAGVFNGKIFVRKDAQKTNAFQQNNNMLLGKKAVIDSKPQLEIFADDVKCSHGSTMGQFNQDALFYLKSRGIGEEKARALLIHAFAFDVTEKIPIPEVQSHINALIEEGLKGS